MHGDDGAQVTAAGRLRDDPNHVIGHLEKPAADLEPRRPGSLDALQSQHAPPEQRDERRVPGEDPDLAVECRRDGSVTVPSNNIRSGEITDNFMVSESRAARWRRRRRCSPP